MQIMKSRKNSNERVEILIAEDSATQREKLKYLLEERGYAVTAAPNGKEALVAARLRKPAVIISDVMMPELDGYSLCKAVKADDKLKDIPLILVTTLSDPRDVIRGLECGADNFIRKPYDGQYLLSRIDYLLMNLEMRKNQKMQMGVEISLGGQKHFITAERQQILDLLISTYEQATFLNAELKTREQELSHSNDVLSGLNRIAEGLNQAVTQNEVANLALERALTLPGIQAGWITLREGETGYRLLAARNLPPALEHPGALDGDCHCRRKLVSGELDSVTNILECERLARAKGDTGGLRYHATVPLWSGGKTIGLMNLAGPQEGLFDDYELNILYGVGNQVAVALERARLHEHLEHLVEERTAALTAEVAERKRVQEEQARLVAILDATPDFVASSYLDGRIFYMNSAGLRMLGLEPGHDISALRAGAGHPEWAEKLVHDEAIPHAIEHGTWSGETSLLRDGREIPVSQVVIAHKGKTGAVDYLSTIIRDLSRRKEAEAKVVRLNRVYSVLSGINTAIVRIHDRNELFEEACRIAVEHGKFQLAWIGLLDPVTLDVMPLAKAGHHGGYLDLIKPTTKSNPDGSRRMTAEAIHTREPVVCNDIAADEKMVQWRTEALAQNYRSLTVFPLVVQGNPLGVFALYSSEPGFFDEQEMKLLIEMAGDISFALDHIEKEEKLNYLAYFDAVTGLPNRELFHDRLEQRVSAAHSEGKTFSLIVLDIERLRIINETLGRQAGDGLLRAIGQRLRNALDETDIVANVGGDSFAIATRRFSDASDAAHFLEEIQPKVLGQPFTVGDQELRVSAKAGIALYPADGSDADTILRNAEAALQDAKKTGNPYQFYAPQMNARVAEKLTFENKLRRALEHDQFVLYYQPKISLATGQMSGLEALIRWNDPETGLVPPGKFIPILEETGMIFEVGKWVLRKAISDFSKWRDDGLKPPRIAVNVSPLQLRRREFNADLQKAAEGGKWTDDCLELEITESLIMENIEENIPKLRAARELGMTIAVDDFGTGYSSLSYIAKLPINALKIDRSFVIEMPNSPDAMSIVQSIMSLAHSLSLKVIAEGVDAEDQVKLLRLLRCDEVQGYLYSKPLSPDHTVQYLQGNMKLP
jgi:diguanylate cyclase (GGDEF)-like protein/PAS domain S-box-containing protein